ncbi:MAG: tRNA (pseudouridine(54)-N(1))-methyltransferase TrmY [Thermoplasmata archaeon]|nr:tRNA (pseudouridine(54)-N(1))-methyltransferase TrmY [Thermoplasmata archaeon]
MRRFLLLAHRVPPNGAFTLNDLAGGAGRMDEVARAVSTAFTLSNDLRRDTEVSILFVAEPPPVARRIDVVGARVRYLNPDERSTAALLKNALVRSAGYPRELESSPGLRVGPVDPATALAEFLRSPGAVWLTEAGSPFAGWDSPEGAIAAVVSDPYEPNEAELEILRGSGVPQLSVGPRSLRTSQVIDLVHAALDGREPRPVPPTPAIGPASGGSPPTSA